MNKPHKHAELIKAWADGAEIEAYSRFYEMWAPTDTPYWHNDSEYRIKPTPKPDRVVYIPFGQRESFNFAGMAIHHVNGVYDHVKSSNDKLRGANSNNLYNVVANIEVTLDGETELPKSVKLLPLTGDEHEI